MNNIKQYNLGSENLFILKTIKKQLQACFLSTNDPNTTNSEVLRQRNREFSIIIHTMRHDIRNCIAAIEGYSYLLKDEFNEDYLDRIFKNITNINDLVDRSVLITDSNLEIEKISEIDLNCLIKTCRETIPKTIEFESDRLQKVQGDYQKILLVFNSLLENSVIHGNAKHIEIHGFKQKDGYYVVQIVNDGNLIPKEKVDTLFTKIPQSLKPKSGLGLLICSKIIHAHNWSLRVNTAITNKTCFEIVIPEKSLIY